MASESASHVAMDPAIPLSVLIVDDEPAVAEAMAEFLCADGHHVATAADGESALALSPAVPFHLVISDMIMPRMAGDGLMNAMRSRPAESFWFVLMSSMPENLVRRRTTSYDGFLPKPIDLDDLRTVLARCAASAPIRARLDAPPARAGTG